jgi:hypothetical protein
MNCFQKRRASDYGSSSRVLYIISSSEIRDGLHYKYAASRKVAGSGLDEVNEFFSIYIILPIALGAGIYSASNRNKYQKQKENVSGE